MFEDQYRELVTLRVPEGTFIDGKPGYTEYPAQALITGFTEYDLVAMAGKIKSGKIFLLKSENEPVSGSQLVYNGQSYDLKSIKVCCGIDGHIECYRCICC
jgi:hypothetical protein